MLAALAPHDMHGLNTLVNNAALERVL